MVREEVLRCICGATVSPSTVLIERVKDGCYAIICPSKDCRLKELGSIRLSHSSRAKPSTELSKMLVDWNILMLGRERCNRLMREFKRKLEEVLLNG